jgi:hypothetical protein
MRMAMLAVVALATILPSLGCTGARGAGAACQSCNHGAGCVRNGCFARNFGPQNYQTGAEEGAGAPQTAQVAYPYYTNRGPRDFLLNNPPPLGY